MKITSSAFKEGDTIPKKYTGDGPDTSPPLHFEDVPSGAKSLALIMDDPDAPKGTFNHWLMYNIDPHVKDIHEGVAPVMASQGRNDFGDSFYEGPRPPKGEHHYRFHAYALDNVLNLPRGCSRGDLDKAMKGHVLDEAELTARYARN